MIRIQLDNGVPVEAPAEVWIVAMLQAFQGPALQQIVKNMEVIKSQQASGLVLPSGITIPRDAKDVRDGLKKP